MNALLSAGSFVASRLVTAAGDAPHRIRLIDQPAPVGPDVPGFTSEPLWLILIKSLDGVCIPRRR